ncbi:MAG: hydroxymethylglutaryl-CoA lyase [Candidatus Kapabacteria bacterium]|nr:hydroxymethylglutaryl-CoA lyase [Candidatus Kapabacteria bacterium]
MLESIRLHEVGLRDGLQNEKVIIPTEKKIQWIETLLKSGLDIIQLGSFVHPEKMPQMADTDLLFNHFAGREHKAVLSGLVLNEKGMERGMKCGVGMFCLGVSASRAHSLKNTGMTTEEAAKRIISIAKEIESAGKKVQVSVQSAFGCGFEGKIPEEQVLNIVESYIDAGLMNISLADTAGHAYPEQVARLFSAVKRINEHTMLTAHFHNTYGLGLANCYAAMNEGAKYFETSFGGLGGCPFTKVAAGNVSTEDFVHSLNRNHTRLDIELDRIFEVSREASELLNKPMQSYVLNAGTLSY